MNIIPPLSFALFPSSELAENETSEESVMNTAPEKWIPSICNNTF